MAKRIVFFLALLLLACHAAVAQGRLRVVLRDGRTVEYALSDVDCLLVDDESSFPSSLDTIAGLGGTLAEGVDLGLSVEWAAHNVGACYDYQCGARLTHASALDCAALWGAGWRLPTEAEWQELLDHTEGVWMMANGVPGRRLTAPNGKSLFLPFVGFDLGGGNAFSSGAMGVYWCEEALRGLYMDSGNVFPLDFSDELRCGVRLVR